MAEVTLQVLEGLERGRVFSNLETPFTIGREISNGVALNDESVSRYHAKIQEDNGRVILTDLGSTNGTRINGHPVQLKVLKPGDQIHIGRCILLHGSLEEIDESLGFPGKPMSADGSGETTSSLFRSHKPDTSEAGSHANHTQLGLELFPLGCPELPTEMTLAQRAQVSDLIAYMHSRIVHLMSEAVEDFNDQEEREVRIPWLAWQRLIRTEIELAQALQKITEPD
jgi:predicted component of type VI protein secretion system